MVMNIINYGSMFDIISGDDVSITDRIPALTLKVVQDRSGFHLMRTNQLHASTGKIYGDYIKKVDKIFRRYHADNDNTGVILSGDKGTGKTMLTCEIAARAQQEGMPVLICDTPYHGLTDFIQSIDQDVMILFDEFEKTFPNKETQGSDGIPFNPQNTMLSMFDGLSDTHHLNVITANNLHGLSDYIINRPGRFHYHIRFAYPNSTEITEFMHDKLPESQYSQIDKIIRFSRRYPLNYDCLTAIASELQYGDDFNDAVKDLNIINFDVKRTYNYAVLIDDGTVIRGRTNMNMASSGSEYISIHYKDAYFTLSFYPSDIDHDENDGSDIIMGTDVIIDGGDDERGVLYYGEDMDETAHVKNIRFMPITNLYNFNAV